MRMKKINKFWLLVPFLMLSGCSLIERNDPVYKILPYQEDMIGLQDLKTRVLVYCYNSEYVSTEQCADEFEKRGSKNFVKERQEYVHDEIKIKEIKERI